MGQKPKVLIDTDILIKIFKGDKSKRKQLENLDEKGVVSIITAMELCTGANSQKKIHQAIKFLRAVEVINLTSEIGQKALTFSKKYHSRHTLHPPDALIAATASIYHLSLYTDNIKHFEFISELNLYKEV